MNLYEYLEKQLDDLSLYQVIAREDVFKEIMKFFPYATTKSNILIQYHYDCAGYKSFYFKSMLLLGISYFEGFFDDIIIKCQETDETLPQDIPSRYKDKISRLKKLNLLYNDSNQLAFKAYLMRHCYSHNKGKVSERLNKSFPELEVGSDVIVTNEILDEMGTHARKLAKELYEDAVKEYNINE